MTATQITPEAALPQYQGRAVPWVTRWTGEVSSDKLRVAMTREGVMLGYPDGNETRDEWGVLWKREGIGRGGEPQYSELNTYRQRACMNKRRCQVCGTKIDERPIRWLMSNASLNVDEDGTALTISPPTCSACIPLALELCPHLKKGGYTVLKVLDYEPWGVYGHAVVVDAEAGRWRDVKGVYVPYDDSRFEGIDLTGVAAYQQIVRLTKYVIEKE